MMLDKCTKFSALCAHATPRIDGHDDFQEISMKIGDIIEEGFNFLCVEASEIIAFVATDSQNG